MKVWIVKYHDWDSQEIIGICSSHKKAKRMRNKHWKKNSKFYHQLDAYGIWDYEVDKEYL